MIRPLFAFLLVMASFLSFAQTDQVITLKGDTLLGKVSFSDGKSYVQTITLKKEKGKSHFKVYEIKSLVINGDFYKTIKVYGKYQLGLVIKEGYLSMYKILDIEVSTSNEYATSVLIKFDGSILIVPNIGFKKQLIAFLKDCKVVVDGLENKEYKKSDVGKMVDDYNNCMKKNAANATLVKSKVNFDSPKLEQVNMLIKAIKVDGSLPDLDSILEMLNDLKSKIKEGTKVPSYLKNALRDVLKTNDEFTKKLNDILA